MVKPDGNQVSRHAFKVMQAYEEWFAGEPELALLHLLGLFDHPIGQEVLQVLWDEQIPSLTAKISEDDWQEAITTLREEHRLLSQHEKTNGALNDQFDCHPLIREYFGQQLRDKQPEAWRHAHARLYEYYKALPKNELPDTLDEMQPLFSAVAHGCAAGLHQQALNEVYSPRIQRNGRTNFLSVKLGALSDDLAVVTHFFITPWRTPAASLTEAEQAVVLSWAGLRLRALGRSREALEPIQASIEMAIKHENWENVAIGASSLCQLQLTLGDVIAAVISGQRSVEYADRSEDLFQRMSKRTNHADALHRAGEITKALELFQEAEQIQQKLESNYPRLYSLQGYYYGDMLLEQGRIDEVLERAEYALKIAKKNGWLLDIALSQLTLGRAHWQQGDFVQAADWLNLAVTGLRVAGRQDYLSRGLLARAALYRNTCNPNHDFLRSCQDLQEVYDIAEPSGMRLHLTDYHLEMAQLLLAERENPAGTSYGSGDVLAVQEHVDKAAKLIEETGYKRRLPELRELQHKLSTLMADNSGAIP